MRPALQHSTERGVLDNSVLQYLSCSQSNILNLLDGSMIFHFFEAAAKDHVTVITAAVIDYSEPSILAVEWSNCASSLSFVMPIGGSLICMSSRLLYSR